MNYALLSVYLVSITLMIATPGPVVAFVLNAAARGGGRQALLTIFGTNGASLVMIAVAALVIMGLLTIDHALLSWISLASCIFLGWMAIRRLRRQRDKADCPGELVHRTLPTREHDGHECMQNQRNLVNQHR